MYSYAISENHSLLTIDTKRNKTKIFLLKILACYWYFISFDYFPYFYLKRIDKKMADGVSQIFNAFQDYLNNEQELREVCINYIFIPIF